MGQPSARGRSGGMLLRGHSFHATGLPLFERLEAKTREQEDKLSSRIPCFEQEPAVHCPVQYRTEVIAFGDADACQLGDDILQGQ